jgi:hypothetical protein
MAENWITTEEAAQLIGVTISHMSYLLRHGYVKGKKFGRFWMVDRASAETYAAQERKTGPKPKNDA